MSIPGVVFVPSSTSLTWMTSFFSESHRCTSVHSGPIPRSVNRTHGLIETIAFLPFIAVARPYRAIFRRGTSLDEHEGKAFHFSACDAIGEFASAEHSLSLDWPRVLHFA